MSFSCDVSISFLFIPYLSHKQAYYYNKQDI